MAFPGLPETSKIQIFASTIYHLLTDNVNAYVSKIYPSGLIFGEGEGVNMEWGHIFGMFIGFYIWVGGVYFLLGGDLYTEGVFTGFYRIRIRD